MQRLFFLLFVALAVGCLPQQPPAKQPSTEVLPAAASLQTENVFLITFDGLRWQELFTGADSSFFGDKQFVHLPDSAALMQRFWHEDPEQRRARLMPFFWSTLAQEGQLYGNHALGNRVHCVNQQWFSYPGYNEILTGYADPAVNSNRKIYNENLTVLEFFQQQEKLNGKVAAFASWDVFPYIIHDERSGIPVNAGFRAAEGDDLTEMEQRLNQQQQEIASPWATVRHDYFTHHYALEYLQKHQPRVMYIAYGETDDFAHDGRYDAYLKSAHLVDGYIGELWDYVQSHERYRNKTTFIITTDHGRGYLSKDAWRSHGTDIEGADEIWLAVIGPDSPARGEVTAKGQFYQNQLARTVAHLMGYEFNANPEMGEALSVIF